VPGDNTAPLAHDKHIKPPEKDGPKQGQLSVLRVRLFALCCLLIAIFYAPFACTCLPETVCVEVRATVARFCRGENDAHQSQMMMLLMMIIARRNSTT